MSYNIFHSFLKIFLETFFSFVIFNNLIHQNIYKNK
jgi:hypothetical protein